MWTQFSGEATVKFPAENVTTPPNKSFKLKSCSVTEYLAECYLHNCQVGNQQLREGREGRGGEGRGEGDKWMSKEVKSEEKVRKAGVGSIYIAPRLQFHITTTSRLPNPIITNIHVYN